MVALGWVVYKWSESEFVSMAIVRNILIVQKNVHQHCGNATGHRWHPPPDHPPATAPLSAGLHPAGDGPATSVQTGSLVAAWASW